MPYIGNTAGNRFVASQAATRLSGNGSAVEFTLEHAVGSDEDILVSVDGVIQEPSIAYAVSNGTTLTFTAAPSNGTNNIFVCYLFRTVATVDHPSTSSLQATDGTFSSTLGVTGASTFTGALSAKGGAVFNEDSADVDFRVESNNDANCLFVDGANDKVGIGTNAPDGFLTINKNTSDSALPSIRLIDNSDAREAFVTNQSGDLIMGVSNSSDDTVDSSINILESNILFKTVNTERARFNSDGRAYFNTTSDLGTGVLQVKLAGTNKAVGIRMRAENAGNWMIAFENSSGTVVGQIIANASSTSYNTSSDHRLKENVTYDFDATARLKQLKPARFNFIADADTTVDGFLAHEVSSIVPEAVNGEKDAVDADGNIDPQGIDQSKLVPLLVKTIQELEARITALESK
tara:strand:- start:614 stop:1828 length:1215 start_codon:yes stop_codon:yes gene_type:complete